MVLKPIKQVKKDLKYKLPIGLLNKIPYKWEKIGDILIIKLDEKLEDYKTIIGQSYAEIIKAKTVLNDIGGITGSLRTPNVEVIYGSYETETIHKENGIRFKLDPKKVMFSSGNMSERIYMSKLSCENEIIIDMFAGIGYFTLPLAVYSNPKKIYACEKNPDSYKYLKENISLNHVTNIIKPLKGDNREIAPENTADRIIMGYIGGTEKFFSKAVKCLKENKGTIHFHEKYPEKIVLDEIIKNLESKTEKFNRKIKVFDVRTVKSFAPKISHFVLDCEII